MKYLLIIFLVPVFLSVVFGQDTYTRVIDHEGTRLGNQIIQYEGRIFIQSGGIYNNILEGVVVMEIDENSNVIWEKHLPWLDVTSGSMIIRDNIISLSGNHNPEQIEFYLHQMSIESGDSLTTYIVDDPSFDLDRMFHLSTIHYNGKFLIGGTGNIANTNLDNSIIYVVDELSGQVDTLLMIDQQTNNSSIWKLLEDLDGGVLAFIRQKVAFGEEFRSVIKLDPEFNVVWKYTSEEDIFNRSAPRGVVLEDGKIVFVVGSSGGQHQIHALRAINRDSTIAWQFDWPDINSFQRETRNIELAKDGSIWITGIYGSTNQATPIVDVPYIAKVSAQGGLIWERGFVQFNEEGELKRGLLYDIEELDDGSLMVIGRQSNENGDILIMKLTADGCLDEDDCGLQNMYTDVSDIVIADTEVKVYPNPVIDAIQISTEIDFERLKIYDLYGRLLQDIPFSSTVNLSTLTQGNYFMKLITSDGKAALKQIMKM